MIYSYFLNCSKAKWVIKQYLKNYNRQSDFVECFQPTAFLRSLLMVILKNFASPQKWQPFWSFDFSTKKQTHKFASISITMTDRVILLTFLTHMASKKSTQSWQFLKNFLLFLRKILAVGSGGSAHSFAYNFPTTRRISFKFGKCIQ